MFDLLERKFLRAYENHRVVCWNNGQMETTKITDKYLSFRVPYLITRLSYPPNAERDYSVSMYVHFIEHMAKKRIDEEKLEINCLKDYLRVYNDIIREWKLGTEAERFYANWSRHRRFKDDLARGKFAPKQQGS